MNLQKTLPLILLITALPFASVNALNQVKINGSIKNSSQSIVKNFHTACWNKVTCKTPSKLQYQVKVKPGTPNKQLVLWAKGAAICAFTFDLGKKVFIQNNRKYRQLNVSWGRSGASPSPYTCVPNLMKKKVPISSKKSYQLPPITVVIKKYK